ncbi:MAG: ABC transporter ATP-binding protein [Desulfobacterales bacterium]|nr:ABC transporter ATP-binding protein [Deltaproteobacteria bacterium]NNL42558.1 ABC transporter ATP-binding protein [Desulfobacterales bacterium]NNM22885.1 ABC transporter ATP-binding protein [Flavobacteriaceae bacterium]
MSEVILKSDAIHTFIGQHHILQGVSFEAKADAVTVLIGRNGAGKSSTLKTIMGLLPASKGKIVYKGEEIQDKKPYAIARMGIGFVPEHMGIFTDLTVEENMQVAMLKEDNETAERLDGTLEMFADLKKFWKAKAGTLSGGQKQMLAIARAIVNDTSLLLIDEPTKGLAPIIINALIEAINQIKKHSVVILVEQNFYMASSVGDDFYILDDGKVVQNGLMQELVQNEEMQSKYLGISKAAD